MNFLENVQMQTFTIFCKNVEFSKNKKEGI